MGIRYVSADEAVSKIKSGSHIHIASASQVPLVLIDALARRVVNDGLCNLHFHHSYSEGYALFADKTYAGAFIDQPFFIGPQVRQSIVGGYADYLPVHLSETQLLYRSGILPCDAALIMVAPTRDGKAVSLGGDVVCSLAAIEVAKEVIAVVNPNVPYTFGDAVIPINKINAFVYDETPLVETHVPDSTEIEVAIGKECAALIPDGACIQMGIGSLPNAIAAQLRDHKHLGMHTEMFSNGLMELMKAGVLDGTRKQIDYGKAVSSFVLGDKALFDFVNENWSVLMMDINYTNNPGIICRNENVVAVNAAVEIDLSGQVCADSVGSRIISGTGGQLDFIRGASMSRKGKSIVAMTSRAKNGHSKIVSVLKLGAGVVTPRASIQWVVTEYGSVNLFGHSLQERANLLISIAHPEDRERLEREAFNLFGPYLKMYIV
jgi:acyl-CoA hydrolase